MLRSRRNRSKFFAESVRGSFLCLLLPVLLTALYQPAEVRSADSSEVSVPRVGDTLLFQQQGMLGGLRPVTDSTNLERHLSQNPTAALFKSMVVPGWGQAGNGKYFKAALFLGMDIWMVSSAIHHGRRASDVRKEWESATEITLRNDLYDQYLDRKDQRNKFTWFAVIVSFVSMFDAYVDAHLSGYPKADKVKIDIRPAEEDGVQASVSYSF